MIYCCSCETPAKVRLIYTCAGASNLGEIADRAGRQLRNLGFGTLSCLAAIGGHVDSFINGAKKADEVIVIDGCELLCAKKNLEHIGLSPKSYILTEMGMEKGKTPVIQENIEKTVDQIMSNQV